MGRRALWLYTGTGTGTLAFIQWTMEMPFGTRVMFHANNTSLCSPYSAPQRCWRASRQNRQSRGHPEEPRAMKISFSNSENDKQQ